jgi:uncharacterized protein
VRILLSRAVDAKALLAACERLPFFPLPNIVLFPGMPQPLHIFELRYRQMLGDALEGHRAIAMVQPLATADPRDATPPVHAIAGLGWIADHEALPDGRANILLQGAARVRLTEIPSGRLYRTAHAELLSEHDAQGVSTRPLVMLGLQIATRVRRHEPRFDLALPPGLEAGAVCDHLSCRLIRDPFTRQRILEELDVRARVELVESALATVLQDLSGDSGPAS